MFYAHFVLAKKGPLSRIWLAAHWDKKLTKAHVFETNIESSVEGILQPKVKMALRTSGHLLLGIVRIYSRKAKYLLADCNEAFIKIKMAFRPGVVDLPEENREAAVQSITLPEVFHDFDIGMPDLPAIDMEATITLNQSRAEDITLKEDFGMGLMNDEAQLYDMTFDTEADIGRDSSQLDFDSQSVNISATEISVAKESAPSLAVSQLASQNSLDAPLNDDGFGGNLDSAGLELENEPRSELYSAGDAAKLEPADLFDDTPMTRRQAPDSHLTDTESDMYDMGTGGSMGCSPASSADGDDLDDINVQPPSAPRDDESSQHTQMNDHMTPLGLPSNLGPDLMQTPMVPPAPREEPETFTLAPLDTTVEQQAGPAVRRIPNRKRKLIIDEVKNISGEEMKAQLSDTSDIVTTLDLAPPTKRLMHWKETGGVDKLLSLPAVENRNSKYIQKLYQSRLVTRSVESDESLVVAPQEEASEGSDIARDLADSRRDDTMHGGSLPPSTPASKRARIDDLPPPTPGRDFNEMGGYAHAPGTDYGSAYTPFTPAPATPAHSQGDFNNTFPSMSGDDLSANFDSLQQSGNMAPPPTPLHPPQTPMQPPQTPMPLPQTPLHEMDSHMDDGAMDIPHHDDSDSDDDAMHSIGDANHDEQADDETFEEFEERIQNRRTVQLLKHVKPVLDSGKPIRFADLVRHNSRKQVAQKFYTFLVLKKQQAVELTQQQAYDELYISTGPKYHTAFASE
ncbi:double-strand-break repair protein rad21-like protein 1 [Galendromus occidentalis]|uniref:Double-strand-break repair protein rad21-like protein 1 n=1 Tax=Galendromus occidentalis TaxID=34638 RepID=A0AAJ7SE66_9ACAR|nr:double-strand-break repair protein rad21-like protein 1 [Galendromus occidentalis]